MAGFNSKMAERPFFTKFVLAGSAIACMLAICGIFSESAYASGLVSSDREIQCLDGSKVDLTDDDGGKDARAASLPESEAEEPSQIQIVKKKRKMKAGASFRFKARLNVGDSSKIKWKVSSKKRASIDKRGKLSAKLPGRVTVLATYGGLVARIKVIIKPKGIIALDPGHSSKVSGGSEPIGPGSGTYKAKDNHGTAGRYTHVPEYKVTMSVASLLKKDLEKRGYKVVLTRKDNRVAVSCKKRAQIANAAKADIFLRIHCDGVSSSAVHGISMQSPGTKYKWARKNHKKIVSLSNLVLSETCRATGASRKGVYYRNDLTGNNWAKMPVTLIEMGFMSNPTEDRKLVKKSYQKKLSKGIAKGIERYFGFKRS